MPSNQKGLRFYAVVDADTVDIAKLKVEGVRAVTFRDLAAIVAPAPYVRSRLGDAELAEYLRVIDTLTPLGPAIPAPPGTVFRDEQVLARWLDLHYGKLHEALGVIERRDDNAAPYDYVRMELGA